MNTKLMFSSKSREWRTPPEFYRKLNQEFHFTLDPCCTKESALCQKKYTDTEDGLKQDWQGERAFVNPPLRKSNRIMG
uniref:Putative methyltransferase n=1 Tax=viral metagenome TaxID=1070528 RepID=A0A6M3X560_9ZZZZ